MIEPPFASFPLDKHTAHLTAAPHPVRHSYDILMTHEEYVRVGMFSRQLRHRIGCEIVQLAIHQIIVHSNVSTT